MITGLIARKIGMSRVFLETGEAVPVTYLKVEDNQIVRTRTQEKDGYNAVVLGVGRSVAKRKGGKEVASYVRQKECKVDSLDGIEVGASVNLNVIPDQSVVTVTGISKGKGFQGVVKRHHFAGGPRSHGSHFKREPGSVGMRALPGRIHKGKRMPGRMGGDTITIKHRAVLSRDEAQGIVAIKGPVPGPSGGYVYVSVESAS